MEDLRDNQQISTTGENYNFKHILELISTKCHNQEELSIAGQFEVRLLLDDSDLIPNEEQVSALATKDNLWYGEFIFQVRTWSVGEFVFTVKKFTSTNNFRAQYEYYQYALPRFPSTSDSRESFVYTREKRKDCPVPMRALLSNIYDNIDNTGNICVWPSESALMSLLILNEKYRLQLHDKHVLELGGGQVGLVGLGLAASGICRRVVISDGNKECVENQVFIPLSFSFSRFMPIK